MLNSVTPLDDSNLFLNPATFSISNSFESPSKLLCVKRRQSFQFEHQTKLFFEDDIWSSSIGANAVSKDENSHCRFFNEIRNDIDSIDFENYLYDDKKSHFYGISSCENVIKNASCVDINQFLNINGNDNPASYQADSGYQSSLPYSKYYLEDKLYKPNSDCSDNLKNSSNCLRTDSTQHNFKFNNKAINIARTNSQSCQCLESTHIHSNSNQFPSNEINNNVNSGIEICIDGKVSFKLNQISLVRQLIKVLYDEETRLATKWSNELDWSSFQQYREIQDKIDMMEEICSSRFSQDNWLQSENLISNKQCIDCSEKNAILNNNIQVDKRHEETFSNEDIIQADTMMLMIESVFKNPIGIDLRCQSGSQLSTKTHQQKIFYEKSEHKIENAMVFKSVQIQNFSDTMTSKQVADENKLVLNSSNACLSLIDNDFGIKYKTIECSHYKKGQNCPLGDKCQFAHGSLELRQATQHPKYKTQKCRNFVVNGHCPFGVKCFFRH